MTGLLWPNRAGIYRSYFIGIFVLFNIFSLLGQYLLLAGTNYAGIYLLIDFI